MQLVKSVYQRSALTQPQGKHTPFSASPVVNAFQHPHFGLELLEVPGQARPWFSCCLSVAQISRDLEVGGTVVADSKGRGRTTSTFDQYCGVGHFLLVIQSVLTHLCPTVDCDLLF